MAGISTRLAPQQANYIITPTKGVTTLAASKSVRFFKASVPTEVVSAWFVPTTALAKHADNYYDMTIYNGGTAGTGTSIIATKSFKNTALTALVPQTLTFSSTVAWRKLDAGDFLVVKYTVAGSISQVQIEGGVDLLVGAAEN
jgi:hypothetical protein